MLIFQLSVYTWIERILGPVMVARIGSVRLPKTPISNPFACPSNILPACLSFAGHFDTVANNLPIFGQFIGSHPLITS